MTLIIMFFSVKLATLQLKFEEIHKKKERKNPNFERKTGTYFFDIFSETNT